MTATTGPWAWGARWKCVQSSSQRARGGLTGERTRHSSWSSLRSQMKWCGPSGVSRLYELTFRPLLEQEVTQVIEAGFLLPRQVRRRNSPSCVPALAGAGLFMLLCSHGIEMLTDACSPAAGNMLDSNLSIRATVYPCHVDVSCNSTKYPVPHIKI